MTELPSTSLARSIATESLADLLGGTSETVLDAALESGALRDIPVIGTITGALKAGRDIRQALYLKKIVLFLRELSSITPEQRSAFVQGLDGDDALARFGESLLLLLERAESMRKPGILGRLMAACILGKLEQPKAMRLCAIVDRCYVDDLDYLKVFKDGVQRDLTPIAESLHGAGLVSNEGIDGGDISQDNAGIIYNINEYGRLLVRYGLGDG